MRRHTVSSEEICYIFLETREISSGRSKKTGHGRQKSATHCPLAWWAHRPCSWSEQPLFLLRASVASVGKTPKVQTHEDR